MKFVYRYRTSDNARHEGLVAAATKAAAYDLLKSQGIRPERVTEAPGIFNKLFGRGKRWIAIVTLSLGVVVLIIKTRQSPDRPTLGLADDVVISVVRRQPIGDPAVIEYGIKTGWADVFKSEGDRFLASFAIPGVEAAYRTAKETDVRECLDRELRPKREDGLEARQVKAMVMGMKEEIKGLLKAGWTMTDVGRAMAKRQDQEIGIYNRAKQEIELAEKTLGERELIDLWKRRNDELRRLGIKTIPLKES